MSVAMADLRLLLQQQPNLRSRGAVGVDLHLVGEVSFRAQFGGVEVADVYELDLKVPEKFPKELPVATEVGGRVPRSPDNHVNPDGSLCLGSPLHLLVELSEDATLVGYFKHCLVPYLYALTRHLDGSEPWIFGELEHGDDGLYEDYAKLLGIKSPEQVRKTLKILSLQKRRANRKPCPCGCGRPVGGCRFNRRLAKLRRMAHRSWFREQLESLSVSKKGTLL